MLLAVLYFCSMCSTFAVCSTCASVFCMLFEIFCTYKATFPMLFNTCKSAFPTIASREYCNSTGNAGIVGNAGLQVRFQAVP